MSGGAGVWPKAVLTGEADGQPPDRRAGAANSSNEDGREHVATIKGPDRGTRVRPGWFARRTGGDIMFPGASRPGVVYINMEGAL